MENKYTPELIATSQFKFSIPLYQRLFAWKKKEVTKLLFDLKEHFAKMPADEPYYLGMLTCIDMKNRSVCEEMRTTLDFLIEIEFFSKSRNTGHNTGSRKLFLYLAWLKFLHIMLPHPFS